MTVYDGKLLVVCRERSNVIFVFGPNNEELENICVDDLDEPSDLVLCPESGLLYIPDWYTCVRRINPVDWTSELWIPNGRTTTEIEGLLTLSIRSRRLLLVTDRDRMDVI